MKAQPINPFKTIVAILIPLAELGLGTIAADLIHNQLASIIVNVIIFGAGLLLALYLYGDVLKADWPKFRAHIWRNLLLAIVGVFALYALLAATRLIIKPSASAAAMPVLLSANPAAIGIIASLTSLFAPFTEEIIFRHVLFYQWRGRGWLTGVMFVVSAIAFGLVHWFNFNGDLLQTVPYMFTGVFFAAIYYFSKNIWQNIMTHFFFDFIQFLSAIFVFVMSLLMAQ
ncbi:CPBP family intramembrane glutamic endopeptidase [Furfurilactobacillus siliginis]|uniref:ABC superfamily ATP binding cassette transporter permease subunit n=1 Tax=Furfurilactobacillus siliginis TaxID=348151 RepID=A0A0R2L2X1_9LACO|nr:CPBP family intramembrane glutamic endopeptidase [Furfurilactobacillus siliginis]KRN96035.1 ABC superfamily ATP binding cassette transporter permease subunit [Furfurilactobacillus siliginis]GEK29275.1 hypothetical protein LSI01_15860 [Furfurilactobacillus siliginis]